MKLERYSAWAKRTHSLQGIDVKVPVAPTGPGFSQPETSPGWHTGMANPKEERAMVGSLTAWINKVVMPFRCHLAAPAQVILDNELLSLMHGGKGQSYADLVGKADAFCEKIDSEQLLSGNVMKPSELKQRFPEMFVGGMGLSLSKNFPADAKFVTASSPTDAIHNFGRCSGAEQGPITPASTMVVHDECRRLFEGGEPGSAWTGICLMGRRAKRAQDVVYLVPNGAVGSHLGFDHSHATRTEFKPGEHGLGGETSHSYACSKIQSKWGWAADDNEWSGRHKDDWFDIQSSGLLWGFSMVKAFNILGHLYAWTSVSTNRFGSSTYYADLGEPDPTLTTDQYNELKPSEKVKATKEKRFGQGIELGIKNYGGATDVAKDWAYRIWQTTKNLK